MLRYVTRKQVKLYASKKMRKNIDPWDGTWFVEDQIVVASTVRDVPGFGRQQFSAYKQHSSPSSRLVGDLTVVAPTSWGPRQWTWGQFYLLFFAFPRTVLHKTCFEQQLAGCRKSLPYQNHINRRGRYPRAWDQRDQWHLEEDRRSRWRRLHTSHIPDNWDRQESLIEQRRSGRRRPSSRRRDRRKKALFVNKIPSRVAFTAWFGYVPPKGWFNCEQRGKHRKTLED